MTRCFTFACVASAALAMPAVAQTSTDVDADRDRAATDADRPLQGAGAQPPSQTQYGQNQFGQTRPGAQAGQAVDFNKCIAGALLLGNHEEIALAKFAQGRAQNPQVKEFAQMMIQDHQQAVSKLSRLAPDVAQKAATISGGQSGAQGQLGNQEASSNLVRQPGQTAATTPGAGQAPTSATEHQIFALQQRVAQECLELTQQELGEKQGEKFDKCYMASQVGAHIGMLAKLRASQQFASGELKQTIEDLEQTVQKHLDHAKMIAQQLEGEQGRQDAPRQTSQRPGATQRAVR